MAVLTLNAPSKLNALSEDMGDELTDHVTALKENSAIRCCVVTGAGKAFSAGGDLQFLMDRHNDTPANNITVMEAFYKRFLCLRKLPVPVIGAINGPAVGAGFCLGESDVAQVDFKILVFDRPIIVSRIWQRCHLSNIHFNIIFS